MVALVLALIFTHCLYPNSDLFSSLSLSLSLAHFSSPRCFNQKCLRKAGYDPICNVISSRISTSGHIGSSLTRSQLAAYEQERER